MPCFTTPIYCYSNLQEVKHGHALPQIYGPSLYQTFYILYLLLFKNIISTIFIITML